MPIVQQKQKTFQKKRRSRDDREHPKRHKHRYLVEVRALRRLDSRLPLERDSRKQKERVSVPGQRRTLRAPLVPRAVR